MIKNEQKKIILDVLFVQNYYEQHLGIMQISALLKQCGFTTDVVIGTKEYIVKKTIEKRPRVVGFYCTTGFHHRNIVMAKQIKKILKDEILIVFGGPHPTFVPDIINKEGVDVICRGEGEYAMLELMESLRENKEYIHIRNLDVKKNDKIYRNELRLPCNIDELPHFDRENYKNTSVI